jgi:hypothetical protein
MPAMSRRLLLVPALCAALAFPTAASAQQLDPAAPASAAAPPAATSAKANRARATVRITHIGNLTNGRAPIMSKVPVTGTLKPRRRGQFVRVRYYLNGHKLFSKRAKVNRRGVFRSAIRLKRGGKYAVSAVHVKNRVLGGDRTVRKSWKVSYRSVGYGDCNRTVRGFKDALRRLGFRAGDGACFNGRTGRAVLAYRKLNNLARNEHAGKRIVHDVYVHKGGYRVKYPNSGDHAEVDISRQILVLAHGGKVDEIYHVSTGAPSTPTVRGHFNFYLRQPGYNSHGMYYSFYFYGGYAIHGYHSVPTYNASHGCVRVPIPDAYHIYNWLEYGDDIHVFG